MGHSIYENVSWLKNGKRNLPNGKILEVVQGPVGLEQCPYFALYLLLIYRVEQLVISTIFH